MYEYARTSAEYSGLARKGEMRKRFPVIEKRIGTETVFAVDADFLGSSLEAADRRLVARGNGSTQLDASFSRLVYERPPLIRRDNLLARRADRRAGEATAFHETNPATRDRISRRIDSS